MGQAGTVQLEAPGFLLGTPWRNTRVRAGIAQRAYLPVTKAFMIFKMQTNYNPVLRQGVYQA